MLAHLQRISPYFLLVLWVPLYLTTSDFTSDLWKPGSVPWAEACHLLLQKGGINPSSGSRVVQNQGHHRPRENLA